MATSRIEPAQQAAQVDRDAGRRGWLRELETAIEIDASAERVWAVVTDFVAYPIWNPFMRKISGELVVGTRLRVRLQSPGGRAMTFSPRVLAATPQRELRWVGNLILPGLFDGEHVLAIEPLTNGRVRFMQSERFRGVLVAPLGKLIDRTQNGFEAMNLALKERVERAVA